MRDKTITMPTSSAIQADLIGDNSKTREATLIKKFKNLNEFETASDVLQGSRMFLIEINNKQDNEQNISISFNVPDAPEHNSDFIFRVFLFLIDSINKNKEMFFNRGLKLKIDDLRDYLSDPLRQAENKTIKQRIEQYSTQINLSCYYLASLTGDISSNYGFWHIETKGDYSDSSEFGLGYLSSNVNQEQHQKRQSEILSLLKKVSVESKLFVQVKSSMIQPLKNNTIYVFMAIITHLRRNLHKKRLKQNGFIRLNLETLAEQAPFLRLNPKSHKKSDYVKELQRIIETINTATQHYYNYLKVELENVPRICSDEEIKKITLKITGNLKLDNTIKTVKKQTKY